MSKSNYNIILNVSINYFLFVYTNFKNGQIHLKGSINGDMH